MKIGRAQETPSVAVRDPSASMRIGVVNFLNAWPLWAALEKKPGVELVPDVPSALAQKLRAGDVDAALISSVEFFRLPEGYTYHPRLCIGAGKEVCSIRFFVPEPGASFAETLAETRVVYADIASRSSVAQLKLVLHAHEVDIPLVEVADAEERIPALQSGEALLSIGDTALRHRARPSFDLQAEYFAIFGRGFVYALWVYRKALQNELEGILDAAKAIYNQNAQAFRKVAVQRFGFPEAFTEDYLTRIIRHDLTAERRSDLEFFAEKLAI